MNKINKNILTGYTLTEIMTAIIIIGVLASLAIPQFFYQLKRIKNQEAITTLLSIYAAQLDYAQENNGRYADHLSDLDISFSTLKNFTLQEESSLVGNVFCKEGNINYLASMASNEEEYSLFVLKDEEKGYDGKIVCMPCLNTGNKICREMGFEDF